MPCSCYNLAKDKKFRVGIKKLDFHHRPLFGLDIGHSSMKIMQMSHGSGQPRVLGYGVSSYYPENAISNGVIVNYEVLSQTLHELLNDRLVGEITTKRVACTIPTSHTFSRPMALPPLDNRQIDEAVKLEAEQYIPIPMENLYLDYDVSRQDEKGVDLVVVATPKNIVDSSLRFLESVGFEPVVFEPTMNAVSRLFRIADVSRSQPTLLIDFGSIAVDIAVFDRGMFVNSTVSGGSDTLTNLIAKKLKLSPSEAYILKSQYGINSGDKAAQLLEAAKPILDPLIREARKTMRYFAERSANRQRKVTQIITTGGGATIIGFNEYLAEQLRVPTRRLNPWPNIDFGSLRPPTDLASSMYDTVAGEAVLTAGEVFG